MAQNFSGKNLKGCSFRGQKLDNSDFSFCNLQGASFQDSSLKGANFSNSDIRGTRFSRADLTGAIFRNARAGLQRKSIALNFALSIFLAFVSSIMESFAVFLGIFLLTPEIVKLFTVIPGLVILIFGGSVFILVIYKGVTDESLGNIVGTGVVSVAGAGSVSVAISHVSLASAQKRTLVLSILGFIAGITSILIISVLVKAIVSGWLLFIATGLSILFVILSFYIAQQSSRGNHKYILVHKVAVTISAMIGTNFKDSNLTDVDFSCANLRNTVFDNANITRALWFNAINLNLASLKNTYLENDEIRMLVTSFKGSNKKFENLSMRGINLNNAENLMGISFINSDLSESTLRQANLIGAKLVRTQLDKTNLSGACLTGACIESIGITTTTELENVDCKYVFMRLSTVGNPDPYRKPDNRQEEFQPGDFADFIRPIIETLDLYHNGVIDPRGIAISFKQLAENNPDADLEIVAMERRGNNKLLIRAKTAENANLSQLNAEYFSTYNQFIALPPQAQAQILAEKDNRIQSLEAMVTTALQRPSFYTETNIQQVDTMQSTPGGISQSVSSSTVHGGLQAIQGDNNQQTMATTVTPSTNEKQLTQTEVIQLLAQIEALIQQAELPTDIKEESALYLGAAKKATEKEEPKKTLAAENLKSMAETLQTASKTIESSKSLWENMKPLLSQLPTWLGVATGFFGF